MSEAAPVILRFTKDSRTATIALGRNPVGDELRCQVDGDFAWSRTCRTPDELRQELTRIRDDFANRGWSPA